MRVLSVGNVYPPHHLGGYEVVWRGVVHALREEGHEARVLTTDYMRPDVAPGTAEDPDVHRELGWYWRDHEWLRMGPRARLELERRNATVFDRHLRELRPEVITWWPVGGMSLGLIERARRAGLPAVLFVLDYWPSYGPKHDLWMRMWRRLPGTAALAERLTGLPACTDLAAAGRWLFCSRVVLEQTLRTGLAITDWTILPPGVERSYLQASPEPEAPAWQWRLLYLGRVVEQKGVRTAIQCLPELPPEASLRIVGEGDEPYRRGLEQLARELCVEKRVEFEPARPRQQLFDVYRAADAVVFPVQWEEPWGLVPLEAMALGQLVVATGAGGSGEYLRDGENSLLFRAGDPRALADALRALASDGSLRARLRAGGFETAAQHSEDAFNARAVQAIRAACGAPVPAP